MTAPKKMRFDVDTQRMAPEDEFLDILGPSDAETRGREPLPFTASAKSDELPGAGELLEGQIIDAVQRLHEDTRKYARFPWRDLAVLAGPICPGDMVMIGARTGGGKSLFLQNLFDSLITAGRCGLYVGLEQSPHILRIKWACLRLGIVPKLVLATPDADHDSPAWRSAMDRVQNELQWQKSPAIREAAHFSAARRINARGLKRWTEWAVERGADFVIVDHIDRIDHGEGKNSFHEVSETVRLAKELAEEHRISMLVASQVGRPGDALEAFMPPALHNLRGAGTKEEEADTVLGIYRPLKPDTSDKDLKRVRQGFAKVESLLDVGVMGVRLLKHRLDGATLGDVKLDVFHGRVMDLEERHTYTTQYGARGQV